MRKFVRCLLLALAGSCCAQMPAQTPPPAAPEPPKLTELQKAHIELYLTQLDSASLRYKVELTNEARPIQEQLFSEIEAVKKANPGWDYHFAASPQDHSGWVKPQATAPATPALAAHPINPVVMPTAPVKK